MENEKVLLRQLMPLLNDMGKQTVFITGQLDRSGDKDTMSAEDALALFGSEPVQKVWPLVHADGEFVGNVYVLDNSTGIMHTLRRFLAKFGNSGEKMVEIVSDGAGREFLYARDALERYGDKPVLKVTTIFHPKASTFSWEQYVLDEDI